MGNTSASKRRVAPAPEGFDEPQELKQGSNEQKPARDDSQDSKRRTEPVGEALLLEWWEANKKGLVDAISQLDSEEQEAWASSFLSFIEQSLKSVKWVTELETLKEWSESDYIESYKSALGSEPDKDVDAQGLWKLKLRVDDLLSQVTAAPHSAGTARLVGALSEYKGLLRWSQGDIGPKVFTSFFLERHAYAALSGLLWTQSPEGQVTSFNKTKQFLDFSISYLDAGVELVLSSSPRLQAFVVLTGKVEFVLVDDGALKRVVKEPGEWGFIPGSTPYAITTPFETPHLALWFREGPVSAIGDLNEPSTEQDPGANSSGGLPGGVMRPGHPLSLQVLTPKQFELIKSKLAEPDGLQAFSGSKLQKTFEHLCQVGSKKKQSAVESKELEAPQETAPATSAKVDESAATEPKASLEAAPSSEQAPAGTAAVTASEQQPELKEERKDDEKLGEKEVASAGKSEELPQDKVAKKELGPLTLEELARLEKEDVDLLPVQLLAMLQDLESGPADPVSLLNHSLQSATRAMRDGADEDTIVIALLHDVAHRQAPSDHAQRLADILKPFISEQSHWVLAHHPIFMTTDSVSKEAVDASAKEQHRGDPNYEACVDFCAKYLEPSFNPDYHPKPLATFEPILRRVLAKPKPSAQKTEEANEPVEPASPAEADKVTELTKDEPASESKAQVDAADEPSAAGVVPATDNAASAQIGTEKELLNEIQKCDFSELMAFSKPPAVVVKVFEATLVLLEMEPSWQTALRETSKPDIFLQQLKDIDVAQVKDSTLAKLEPYLQDESFTVEKAEVASRAAGILCKWVLAVTSGAKALKGSG